MCNGDIVYYDGNTHSYSNVPQGSAGESRYNCDSGCRQTVQNTGFGTICESMPLACQADNPTQASKQPNHTPVIANSKDSGKTKSPGKPHTPEQRNFKDLIKDLVKEVRKTGKPVSKGDAEALIDLAKELKNKGQPYKGVELIRVIWLESTEKSDPIFTVQGQESMVYL